MKFWRTGASLAVATSTVAAIVTTILATILATAATAAADADECKNYAFSERVAKAAATRLRESGRYLKPAGPARPPSITAVQSVQAREHAASQNWRLEVNGSAMHRLSDIYVPDRNRSDLFVPLRAEVGCTADPHVYPAGPPDPAKPLPFVVSASAVSATSTMLGSDFSLSSAVDGKPETAWCEGAFGPGVGESVTVSLASRLAISAIRLTPHITYPLPTAVTISVDGGRAQRAVVKPGAAIPISRGAVRSVQIAIAAGSSAGVARTCIGEIGFADGPFVYATVRGVPESAVAALNRDVSAFFRGLRTCDRNALTTYVKYPLERHYFTDDEAGHYEGDSKRWASARQLIRECKRGARGYAPGQHLRAIAAPYFAVADVRSDIAPPGTLVLAVGSDFGPEFWRFRWSGRHWQLDAANDVASGLGYVDDL